MRNILLFLCAALAACALSLWLGNSESMLPAATPIADEAAAGACSAPAAASIASVHAEELVREAVLDAALPPAPVGQRMRRPAQPPGPPRGAQLLAAATRVTEELAAEGIVLTQTEAQFVVEATARHRLRMRELQQTPMRADARGALSADLRTRFGDELARFLTADQSRRVFERSATLGGSPRGRTKETQPAVR